MKEILLRELFRNTDQYQDKEVTVRGWIRNNRSSNKFGFIELNDGSFFKSVQVVYEEEFIDNFEEISKAYVASALNVRGVVTLTSEFSGVVPPSGSEPRLADQIASVLAS